MSITYTGSVDWALADWPVVSQDAWGVDVVTLQFSGRSDAGDAFVESYKRDRTRRPTMPTGFSDYPWATLDKIELSPHRSFSRATVIFKGIAGNRLPKPVLEFGFRAQQCTLPYIGDVLGESTGAQASFFYRAPYSEWRYVVRGRPKEPKERRIYVTKNSLAIRGRSGSPGTLALFRGKSIDSSDIYAGDTLSNFGKVQAYNGVVEASVAQFKASEVGHNIWECLQVNEVIIVPLDMANSGLFPSF